MNGLLKVVTGLVALGALLWPEGRCVATPAWARVAALAGENLIGHGRSGAGQLELWAGPDSFSIIDRGDRSCPLYYGAAWGTDERRHAIERP